MHKPTRLRRYPQMDTAIDIPANESVGDLNWLHLTDDKDKGE